MFMVCLCPFSLNALVPESTGNYFAQPTLKSYVLGNLMEILVDNSNATQVYS